MYFVRFGRICVRYTGTDWNQEDLPVFTAVIDYDNEIKWSVNALESESRRTDFGGADRDEDAHAAAVMELSRRKGGEDDCLCSDWDVVLMRLEDDEDDYVDRWPIIFPDELSLPTRKLIREVAKIEHEEIAFRKKNLNKTAEEIDEATQKEFLELDERGWKIREDLLDSDLGDEILDMDDPVEDMKMMASQLLFLYAQTRSRAETEGGEPEEDFFYAGSNLYAHAVVDQVLEENEDDEEDDPENRLDSFFEHFGEYVASGDVNDEILKDFDEISVSFLADKGFDITTLAGAKAAQKFLENADLGDAFWTEGPVEDEMDKQFARIRPDAMLACVKARIERMIQGKK